MLHLLSDRQASHQILLRKHRMALRQQGNVVAEDEDVATGVDVVGDRPKIEQSMGGLLAASLPRKNHRSSRKSRSSFRPMHQSLFLANIMSRMSNKSRLRNKPDSLVSQSGEHQNHRRQILPLAPTKTSTTDTTNVQSVRATSDEIPRSGHATHAGPSST